MKKNILKMIIASAFLLAIMLSMTVNAEIAGINYISNYSFEELVFKDPGNARHVKWSGDLVPVNWYPQVAAYNDAFEYFMDGTLSRSGLYSLRISGLLSTNVPKGLIQYFPWDEIEGTHLYEQDKIYEFSVWMRAESSLEPTGDSGFIQINLRWGLATGGSVLHTTKNVHVNTLSGDWVKVSVRASAPADANNLMVHIQPSIPQGVTVWFDDVFLGLPGDQILYGNDTAVRFATENPFSDETGIAYTVSRSRGDSLLTVERVMVKIYTLDGEELIRAIRDEPQDIGVNIVPWDGRDDDGNQVKNGLYKYIIEIEYTDHGSKIDSGIIARVR